jgi:hypothetical protein
MRFTSILSFVLTLVVGISLAQVLLIRVRPFTEWVGPSEWLQPSFNINEANEMVGHRVRCAYRTDTFSGGCEIGDEGEVVGIEKVPDGGYFIVVRWDGQTQEEPCYYGRYSRRVVLGEE